MNYNEALVPITLDGEKPVIESNAGDNASLAYLTKWRFSFSFISTIRISAFFQHVLFSLNVSGFLFTPA